MNHSQFLGKSTEMLVTSKLLAEEREMYMPCVDDHGVDLIVRTRQDLYDKNLPPTDCRSYEFQEIQVKSMQNRGLYVFNCKPSPNYWFVFYLAEPETMWLIPSMDLPLLCSINKNGNNKGKYTLNLKPTKKEPVKLSQYTVNNFSKLV